MTVSLEFWVNEKSAIGGGMSPVTVGMVHSATESGNNTWYGKKLCELLTRTQHYKNLLFPLILKCHLSHCIQYIHHLGQFRLCPQHFKIWLFWLRVSPASLSVKWLQWSSGYAFVHANMFEELFGGGGGGGSWEVSNLCSIPVALFYYNVYTITAW